MNDKDINSLDLIIIDQIRGVRKQDQFKHNCHFSREYEHSLHSKDNLQLNSMVDLIISQGKFLDKKILELNEKLDKFDQTLNRLQASMDKANIESLKKITDLRKRLNIDG